LLLALNGAVSAYSAGRLVEAERVCQQIISGNHHFFDAIHFLAIVQASLGKNDEALASYDRALALRPDSTEALYNRGNSLRQLKRFNEALASYDRALTLRPDYATALSNRGVTLYELKRFDEALANYDRALTLRTDYAEAHYNRGNALAELKRFDEALASYDRALALRPDYAEALYNRGVTLYELKRFDEALAGYNRALFLRPDFVEVHSNRGDTLAQLKRFDEALASYDRAVTLRPDYAEALYNRGNALAELKRFDEALASYDRALVLRPDLAEALTSRGNTQAQLKRFDEALASYDRALALRPDYADAHWNEALLRLLTGDFSRGLVSYDRALALRPDYAEALSNRGNTLAELKRFDEAMASYDRALALRPAYVEALSNRGVILHRLKRFDEALASYDRALALRPDYADAHWNEALLRLLTGDFSRGWDKYEWRWKNESIVISKRNFPQPLWRGEDAIKGKSILLHSEQGFGDTIQFCRYVPLVAARGARVILEVRQPLKALMTNLAGATQVIASGSPLPDFDFQCPLLSLPLAFDTQLETIPSDTPYLHAPSQGLMNWDVRFGGKRCPRIGLAWSGNPAHKRDQDRSISLHTLLPLLGIEATFVSLQKDVRPVDTAVLKERDDILHFDDAFGDFSDTAALISHLDLVISVDTSIAHLAGALGKPVWILVTYIPDWRWLLDRDDSPWYPTARLFRQNDARDWDSVIVRVHEALSNLIESAR
jgi:tetratricopeptide (TPR) repeat protein